jgi:hypothetical protein
MSRRARKPDPFLFTVTESHVESGPLAAHGRKFLTLRQVYPEADSLRGQFLQQGAVVRVKSTLVESQAREERMKESNEEKVARYYVIDRSESITGFTQLGANVSGMENCIGYGRDVKTAVDMATEAVDRAVNNGEVEPEVLDLVVLHVDRELVVRATKQKWNVTLDRARS